MKRKMRGMLVKDIHRLKDYPVFDSRVSQQVVTFGSVEELMAFLQQQHPLCPLGCDPSALTKFDYFKNHMLIQVCYKCTDKGPSVEDEENFLRDFKVDDGDDLDLLLGLDPQGQGTRSDLGEEQDDFVMELE
ncbi:hypothetical protein SELMODRAFT_416078 [Selaginella moellendorffii]|uniref:Uncharacterized protein n=1 Tax=Selaginella moellendorffii TaxID=88036 RepID=D8RY06_SELML|nr:hypothetical protein SELMODRAFT_416078 [Selaginella moellendorffii]